MAKRKGTKVGRARVKSWSVADVCHLFERIAPLRLAQDWDNVGLIAGDLGAKCKRILLCIDLTDDVLVEAQKLQVDMILAYHPVLFKPVSRLTAQSEGTDSLVWGCIRCGISVYAMHTALDAAPGGTNDVLAELAGVRETAPWEFADDGADECKLVTFVPEESLDRVADALFRAGAGWIGDYSRCSFRILGQGTFLGGEATEPVIGKKGKLEHVRETRLEVVVPRSILANVTAALGDAHPYEEPAFDVYPLVSKPVFGMGRIGLFARPTTLRALAGKLKKAVAADSVQIVGKPTQRLKRAAVCVGAAGSAVFKLGLGPEDVLITGEIRHHDALSLDRISCAAVALGHCVSERPVLKRLADRLRGDAEGIRIDVSKQDRSPFAAV